jgi:hypothetical protein
MFIQRWGVRWGYHSNGFLKQWHAMIYYFNLRRKNIKGKQSTRT